MQGPMLKALRRFTQLLRVHIYIPGCCNYIRMANGLQPLADLCMDGCCADKPETRDFLANGYFSKATLAVEIIKVRFGVKYSTTGLITLVILINGQPV
jgi:hypothetical protein